MIFLVGILGVLTEFGAIVSFIMNKLDGHNTSMNSSIGAAFVWLANPLILLSLILLKKKACIYFKYYINRTNSPFSNIQQSY